MVGRVPVRLYVRCVSEDVDDLEDAPHVDSWEKISYVNQPVEIQGEGKKTLYSLKYGVQILVNVVNLFILFLFFLELYSR